MSTVIHTYIFINSNSPDSMHNNITDNEVRIIEFSNLRALTVVILWSLTAVIIHSKYFPDSDWLKAHV